MTKWISTKDLTWEYNNTMTKIQNDMETQEELEKRKDVVRSWLAEFESNYNEELLEVVAEIQAADVQKNDAYLVKMARDVISEIERRIKILEEEK